ncbi:MAG: DUF3048 domain-containing protein [Ilumatobacteraceae bacterium]
MKLIRPVAALAALAFIAAACGGGGDDSAPTTESTTTTSTTTTVKATTTTAETTTTTTVPEPTIRQPLTGTPLENADEILQRAALVAKIDNNPAAVRNHSGLGVADIVYEEVVEGRTTRFAAVFHSQGSDPIGPIRSGRTQDVNLFTSYNFPLFVWSGGNGNVTRAINDSDLINMGPNNASGYYRGAGSAPHNLYTSTDNIWFQTPEDQPGPPPPQFTYLEEGEEFAGAPSAGVQARIGSESVEWTWNPEFGKFDRSQRGSAHDDNVTGRIRSTNVIVMGVDYRPSVADARSPEAQTLGEGPVWIFSNGTAIEGVWRREYPIFPIEYFDLDGEKIPLQPGNTWVELADNDDVAEGRIVVLPAT